ncbi:hypothetical protein, partial [Serratia marcescens]|uniref:hypothetical protein n=1 Tax=Serratia marcescens TaxID=615 RepID=UPI001BCF3A57
HIHRPFNRVGPTAIDGQLINSALKLNVCFSFGGVPCGVYREVFPFLYRFLPHYGDYVWLKPISVMRCYFLNPAI